MFASFSDAGARRGGKRRRGFVLLTTAAMVLLVLLPTIGLAVDVGIMYLVQTVLSAACDAASLAGAQDLSRGSNSPAQLQNAQTTANTFFNSNFPSGYFGAANLQVASVAAIDSTYMRSVTTTASVQLPLIFMGALGLNNVNLSASAKATRRDVNIMIVMDRSGSLTTSGSCTPLKAAAVSFVDKFAEGRDNVGLITFATSSRVDVPLSTTFKTTVEGTLNNVVCTGATSSAQALWQSYQQLASLAQTGALNAILFFTDGRPTAVTENFPIGNGSGCTSKTPKLGVLTPGHNTSGAVTNTIYGLYNPNAPAQPLSSDLTVISSDSGCAFKNDQTKVTSDVSYAPLTDYWGNSLTATAYRSVTTSGAGLSIIQGQNVENFSTNAADDAALRIRRGDADPLNGNLSLPGVVIYSIGLGNVDSVLLERIANDPSLTPNPVAAGNNGRYVYAANATELNLAFTQVASQLLRLAQ
ncbi:MAG: VWA domain-containing protein [Candidatus Solibacter sp.]|jgi:Mg-chelatase subunit ChlD